MTTQYHEIAALEIAQGSDDGSPGFLLEGGEGHSSLLGNVLVAWWLHDSDYSTRL